MSSIANPGNFLRVQRSFPSDPQALTVEINKAYVDIANEVNSSTSGIYGTAPIITREAWFLNGEAGKQQTLRQVYKVTGAGNIPHGIVVSSISGFTRIYGTFTDGSIWYPLPFVSATSATNQISVEINSTNIVITAGAGSPPAISSGIIVLEWLSLI